MCFGFGGNCVLTMPIVAGTYGLRHRGQSFFQARAHCTCRVYATQETNTEHGRIAKTATYFALYLLKKVVERVMTVGRVDHRREMFLTFEQFWYDTHSFG